MSKKKKTLANLDDLGGINPAEVSALSTLRGCSPGDERREAFKWFESVADQRGIRDFFLKELKGYVDESSR